MRWPLTWLPGRWRARRAGRAGWPRGDTAGNGRSGCAAGAPRGCGRGGRAAGPAADLRPAAVLVRAAPRGRHRGHRRRGGPGAASASTYPGLHCADQGALRSSPRSRPGARRRAPELTDGVRAQLPGTGAQAAQPAAHSPGRDAERGGDGPVAVPGHRQPGAVHGGGHGVQRVAQRGARGLRRGPGSHAPGGRGGGAAGTGHRSAPAA